jgi:hypothetical protein
MLRSPCTSRVCSLSRGPCRPGPFARCRRAPDAVGLWCSDRVLPAFGDDGAAAADALRPLLHGEAGRAGGVVGKEDLGRQVQAASALLPGPLLDNGPRQLGNGHPGAPRVHRDSPISRSAGVQCPAALPWWLVHRVSRPRPNHRDSMSCPPRTSQPASLPAIFGKGVSRVWERQFGGRGARPRVASRPSIPTLNVVPCLLGDEDLLPPAVNCSKSPK